MNTAASSQKRHLPSLDNGHKPLGYLLKTLDNELECYVNNALQSEGSSRSDWQILRTVNNAPGITIDEFKESARTHYTSEQVDQILSAQIKNSWLSITDTGAMHLTEQGKRQFELLEPIQNNTYTIAMKNISDDDISTTLFTLEKIIANLQE